MHVCGHGLTAAVPLAWPAMTSPLSHGRLRFAEHFTLSSPVLHLARHMPRMRASPALISRWGCTGGAGKGIGCTQACPCKSGEERREGARPAGGVGGDLGHVGFAASTALLTNHGLVVPCVVEHQLRLHPLTYFTAHRRLCYCAPSPMLLRPIPYAMVLRPIAPSHGPSAAHGSGCRGVPFPSPLSPHN